MKHNTTEEWARAWQAVIPAGSKGDDRFRTSKELKCAMGISIDRTLTMLHDLEDAGRLMTRRVKRKILGGATISLLGYALKEGGK